ncbi:MAG: cytidine deaminase [Flavobacteriales bacterium CG_4_10_14_0_2_um_filter_32_8]|nr:MAG: cytidine deaminase [Flavobacteriales bacterium CG_4_10_14_0_2_um_filter_32_8]PJB15399.1 MAG: cytidine deaminase [Flavobacteriales bacterium CG_4_9_14_3_um_filter_32_8]
MNKKNLIIEFSEYNSLTDGVEKSLVLLTKAAEKNLKNSYSPYSQFKVSSAIKLANGNIILGTNQENAAYPSGICAERVAIFSAKSTFPEQDVIEIAIVTEQSNPTPFSPCGACRQVLMEYEMLQKKPIKVILKSGNSKIWVFNSIKDLLPFGFDAVDILKK